MDLVTMILACSLYTDNSIVNAMVQVGSQNRPLTVSVDGSAAKSFTSPSQAVNYSMQKLQQGQTIDIGLLQISSIWLKSNAINLSEQFHACKNMVTATKILNTAMDQCSNMSNPAVTDPKICALSIYKTGSAQAGLDYANAVLSYAEAHPFSTLQAEAEAKNPAGFNMIPGDAPTTISTPNATSVNPSTDKTKGGKAVAKNNAIDTTTNSTPADTSMNDADTPAVGAQANDNIGAPFTAGPPDYTSNPNNANNS